MENNKNIDALDVILERIKRVLNVGTYKEMLEKLGIPRSTLDTWKHRKEMPDSQIVIIANKIGVSREYLESGVEPAMLKEENISCEKINIPYHSEVYASAGGGSDNHSMANTSPMSFTIDFLHSFLGIRDLGGLSIINAAGDSMYPTIRSGELMFVYPDTATGFRDGAVYIIVCGSDLYVKRVWKDPLTHEYTLSSDNPKVADTKLTIDEGSECRFIGRVVGHFAGGM